MRNETENLIHAACYIAVVGIITLAYREPIIAIARDIRIWYKEQAASLPHSIANERGKMWDDIREAINNG